MSFRTVHGTHDGSAQIIALSILLRVMRNECQCISTTLTKLLSRPFADPFESRQCENLAPSTSVTVMDFPLIKIRYLKTDLELKVYQYQYHLHYWTVSVFYNYSLPISLTLSLICSIFNSYLIIYLRM